MSRVFCVSFFEGTLDLLKYSNHKYFVYFKGDENLKAYSSFPGNDKALIPNTGFNLSAYFHFIVNHYENLPEIVVFCKNNTYPRHVSEEVFARLSQRNVYTPIVEPSTWGIMRFPVAAISSAGDYLEFNNSWYARGKDARYFRGFNNFFQFLFPTAPVPSYLRFGPGANLVVPRAHILLRSKNFYANLLTLINYETHALESYFVERALDAIFNSPFPENHLMSNILDLEELNMLKVAAARNTKISFGLYRAIEKVYFSGMHFANKFLGIMRDE